MSYVDSVTGLIPVFESLPVATELILGVVGNCTDATKIGEVYAYAVAGSATQSFEPFATFGNSNEIKEGICGVGILAAIIDSLIANNVFTSITFLARPPLGSQSFRANQHYLRLTYTYADSTTPTQFTFLETLQPAPSTLTVSSPIIISGISSPVPASVSGAGGEWNKNGGAFSSSAGNVSNGDVVRLRNTSPASPGTSVVTTFSAGA
jgi:hypothetical protein